LQELIANDDFASSIIYWNLTHKFNDILVKILEIWWLKKLVNSYFLVIKKVHQLVVDFSLVQVFSFSSLIYYKRIQCILLIGSR